MLFKAIEKKQIEDVVVRLIYQLRSEQIDLIENSRLHEALTAAHSYSIQAELVSQLARPRIPELDRHTLDPLAALKTYLGSREDLKEIEQDLMDAAEELLAGGTPEEVEV
jgi:exonuclease SbcD